MTTEVVAMPDVRPAWKRWLVDSALARIVIFVLVTALIGTLMVVLMRGGLGWDGMPPHSWQKIVSDILVRVVTAVAAYGVIVRLIEKRRIEELAWRRLLPGSAIGVAGAMALIGGVIVVLWAAGAYRVTGTNGEVDWLRPLLVIGVATAVLEEIIFRGVLFRIVDEAWGLVPALAISALFFGGVHIKNPNADLWTSFAIAVEAGILLGAVYHVTRSLWVCIGLHAIWNFLAGTVFGSPVSGVRPSSSWLSAEFTGPEWLTGGSFGIEGSVLTVLFSLAASAALLAAHKRRTAQNEAVA